jgi:hypothetical protein
MENPYSGGDNVLTSLLAQDHPEVFQRFPELSKSIKASPFIVDRIARAQDEHLGLG